MRCGTSRVSLGDDVLRSNSLTLSETVAGVRTDDQRGNQRGYSEGCSRADLMQSFGRHTP
jgi:hypothetical protein